MRRFRPLIVAAVGLLGASPTAAGINVEQAPATVGTGAISGVVVDGLTNAPIARAIVVLGGLPVQVGQPGPRQLTDDKGRFVFTGLRPLPDGYSITASKAGYAGRYGRSAGQRIILRDGEWFSDARVEMYRPSSISGTVTDEHGDPVVGAYVRALLQVTIAGVVHVAGGPVVKTDDRGAYRLMRLAPGKYIVSVPSVQVSAHSASMAPPLAGVPGRPEPPPLEPSAEIDATTRVILGRYPMPRPAADGRLQVYAPAFYPGTSLITDAQPIEIARGEDRASVDLQLRPVPTVRVEGRLVGTQEALSGFTVRLLAPGMEHAGNGAETATTLSGPDGVFVFPAVPAGRYTVDVRRTFSEIATAPGGTLPAPPPPAGLRYSSSLPTITAAPTESFLSLRYQTTPGEGPPVWGREALVVERDDVANFAVPMKRGVTISGRGVFESGVPRLFIVGVEPADGNVANGSPAGLFRTDEPGTFVVEGLLPGKYFLRFSASAGSLTSIVWNGRDMTSVPFDAAEGRDFADVVVTFTDKKTEVSGTVRDGQGQLAPGAIVIAFPVERDQWTNFGLAPPRLRQRTAGSNGTFRDQTLPAGEYFVVALDPDESDGWRDAKFLEAASALATRVTLVWGDAKTIDVKVVDVKVRR